MFTRPQPPATALRQRGGFTLGMVAGLLVGLALALVVALYISKAPSPLVERVPHQTPEQANAEAERLKSWDPNAGLGGKPVPTTPMAVPGRASDAASGPPAVVAPDTPDVATAATSPPPSSRDPAALLAGQATPAPRPPVATPPAPVPEPARPREPEPAREAYYVQAGAFNNAEDAEQQRARLAMAGVAARVQDSALGGRHVHRVRVGPFERREDAEAALAKIRASGSDAALVRGTT